jgi:multicomponent K+:H+ antiporter subunit D
MGLSGAFLTADLFNLFVFFEVLLIASYALMLHGAGRERLKNSVHYVSFNLTGSALFLIAVSLLYGLTGTLNMADLGLRLSAVGSDRVLLAQSASLLLLVVFCVKAALLPLYFWLPGTYASASAPVAALFAIMTKVGVYAVLRVSTVMFGGDAGPMEGVAGPWLTTLAVLTLVAGAIGALAARHLRTLVAYGVVVSAGTLLLAMSLGNQQAAAAGLFYLVNSTLVAAGLFLLADRIAAARASGLDTLVPTAMADGRIPLAIVFVLLAVASAGMPPLAGFLGKALLLQAVGVHPYAMPVVASILASSLLLVVAFGRAGSTLFWETHLAPGPASAHHGAPSSPAVPRRAWHDVSLGLLLGLVLAIAVFAGPLAQHTERVAGQLFAPDIYRSAVLGAKPVPAAIDVRREMREAGLLQGKGDDRVVPTTLPKVEP